jgi:hypothetical protein
VTSLADAFSSASEYIFNEPAKALPGITRHCPLRWQLSLPGRPPRTWPPALKNTWITWSAGLIREYSEY